MDQPRKPPNPTRAGVSGTTGRDDTIDFAAKVNVVNASERASPDRVEARLSSVMGSAVIALWGDLPQGIQEQLFERAVLLGHHGEPDEMLREQLAKFLHGHHKRTPGIHGASE